MKSIITVQQNFLRKNMAKLYQDIVYSAGDNYVLKCNIMQPWDEFQDEPNVSHSSENRYPAIVFVQGSGWTCPDTGKLLPELAFYARKGFVIMIIDHRNCLEGHPFPAYLQDLKCAIRFLRAHAQDYSVDVNRIGVFGTSSGANASLLAALTADDPEYKTEEYSEYSDRVKCVVDCFGPVEISHDMLEKINPDLEKCICGANIHNEIFQKMSPLVRINDKMKSIPVMIIHGDCDQLIPYTQSEKLFYSLAQINCPVEMVRVSGAIHGGGVWSTEVFDMILDFLKRSL